MSRLQAALCSFAIAFAALPSAAQWYGGGTVGQSRASTRGPSPAGQLLDLGFDDAGTSFDRTSAQFRLHLGYRFHRYLAAELGYDDLGKLRSATDVLPNGFLDSSTSTRGADLSILGMWPVWRQLSLMARAGAFAARTRTTYSSGGSVLLVDGATPQSRNNTRPVYGVGIIYDVSPRAALRAEWARYTKLGNAVTGGEFDDRTWSIGLQWQFW